MFARDFCKIYSVIFHNIFLPSAHTNTNTSKAHNFSSLGEPFLRFTHVRKCGNNICNKDTWHTFWNMWKWRGVKKCLELFGNEHLPDVSFIYENCKENFI